MARELEVELAHGMRDKIVSDCRYHLFVTVPVRVGCKNVWELDIAPRSDLRLRSLTGGSHLLFNERSSLTGCRREAAWLRQARSEVRNKQDQNYKQIRVAGHISASTTSR